MLYQHLFHELEVIASQELEAELAVWYTRGLDELSPEQREHLTRYVREELGGYGMLSVEKARECGHGLATERREARALLKRFAASNDDGYRENDDDELVAQF